MNPRSAHFNADPVPGFGGVPGQHEPSLAGHTVTALVIEDDRAVLRGVTRLLRSRGFRVLAAEGGSDALQVMDSDPNINIVLIDVVLPDMTGMQVAALITEKHPNIPIIFTTGAGNLGDFGIADTRVLRKPFSAHDLFAKITAAMP
jgi:CheY-like chemotaxis protein